MQSKSAQGAAVVFLERGDVKDQLEGLVSQMVERGILFDEAVGEFEKRFIKRVLDRVDGNQSRAAHMLGIHRTRSAGSSANTNWIIAATATAASCSATSSGLKSLLSGGD